MRQYLRLVVAAISLVFVALVSSGGTALAANYHFVGTPTCYRSTDALTCSFSVAGLGNQESTARVSVTANYYDYKVTNGSQYVRPGGLATSPTVSYPVVNGRVDVGGLTVTAKTPDGYYAVFTSPASVWLNGIYVGPIYF